MFGGDELAIGGVAQRGDLHEIAHSVLDTGVRQCQWTAVMDCRESLPTRFTQDAGDVHDRIDTV